MSVCMHWKSVKRTIFCLSALGTASSAALALGPGDVQMHGFVAQGLFYTSDNRLFGPSPEISRDFNVFGLNGSASVHPDVRLSAQLLARNAGETDDGEPRLDFAKLDYTVSSGTNHQWNIHGGRIKIPFGLYNDTRDVPFTRPSILLPESIYFDRTRELGLSADGVGGYGEYRLAAGSLFVDLLAGLPRSGGRNTELALFGSDVPGSVDPAPSYSVRVQFLNDQANWRVAVSRIDAHLEYDSALAGALPPGDVHFKPWLFSVQHMRANWSLTAEYALRPFQFDGFAGTPLATIDVTGESYYLQAQYTIAEDLHLLLRYDVLYLDRDDRDGEDYAARTGAPAHTRFAKDWTIGTGWDVSSNWLLRFEYHHVDGTGWLPAADNPDPAQTTRRWDLVTALVSFRF